MTLYSLDFRHQIAVPESLETPVPRVSDGDNYTFRFRFEHKTGDDGAGLCYRTCTQAFNALSKGPCKIPRLFHCLFLRSLFSVSKIKLLVMRKPTHICLTRWPCP